MRDEIYAAIKCIKSGKAAGVDDIPAEFLKILEGETLNKLEELCREIYNSGIWPDDFTKSVIYQYQRSQMQWTVQITVQ